MRGLLLSLYSHLSSLLLVSLLVFSTHLLWAQGTSTRAESAVPLPDAPSTVQTHLHLTYKFPLIFTQNQGQTESWLRFFPDRTGYDFRSVNINAVSSHDTKTIRLRAQTGTSSAALRPSGRRLLPPSAMYIMRRPMASRGLAPSSCESVSWLKLTRISQLYSRQSIHDSDCLLLHRILVRLGWRMATVVRPTVCACAGGPTRTTKSALRDTVMGHASRVPGTGSLDRR